MPTRMTKAKKIDQKVTVGPDTEETVFELGKGNDVLTFEGSTNFDLVLDGGTGFDVFKYKLSGLAVFVAGDGVFVFTNDGVNTFVTSGFERIVALEADAVVQGSEGADNVLSDRGSDQIDALGGNDIAKTGRGADVLLGGEGDDFLAPGRGEDTVDGGAGRDTISYAGRVGANGSGVIVDLDLELAQDTGGDIDTVTLIENVRGSRLDDTLRGDDAANTLWGGTGDDTLRGRGGEDLLRGQGGADRLLGGGQNDRLFGGGGEDTLRGGSGADVLNGGAGDDILSGDAGADIFVFAAGARGARDVITDFEDGVDLLDVSALGIGVGDKLTIRSTATPDGGVEISDGKGLEIVLIGFDVANLGGDDFIFAG